MNEHTKHDTVIGERLAEIQAPDPAPGFNESLRSALEVSGSSRKPSSHRWLYTALPAAAASIVVAVLVGISVGGDKATTPIAQQTSTTPTTEFAPTLASHVLARARSSFAEMHILVGHMKTTRTPDKPGMQKVVTDARFRMRDNGDMWVSSGPSKATMTQQSSYDADTNTLSERFGGEGDMSTTNRIVKNAGPLGSSLATGDLLRLSRYQGMLSALIADDTSPLKYVVYNGRAAWQFETKNQFGELPGRQVVTVDKETQIPVHVEYFENERQVFDVALSDLVVDPPLADTDFELERFPELDQKAIDAGRTHNNTVNDFGYWKLDLAQAASNVGYQPVTPSYVPDGFELRSVFVNRETSVLEQAGNNPPKQDVVRLVYARGLETFEVSTWRSKPAGATSSAWIDPFTHPGDFEAPVDEQETPIEKYAITDGVFAGTAIEIKPAAVPVPHLWGIDNDLILTISGTISRDDMVKIANSLTAMNAGDNVDKLVSSGIQLTPAEVAQITKVIGYQPLYAADVPKGFHLAQINYTASSAAGNCAGSARAQGVVDLTYVNDDGGHVMISTWKSKPLSGAFEPGLGLMGSCSGDVTMSPEPPVQVTSGAFKGLRLQATSYAGQAILWGIDDSLVMVIRAETSIGNATRLANAMQRF